MVVLILILMEHAQRGGLAHRYTKWRQIVLILILMEHAQRDENVILPSRFDMGLNPYFNGTCSKRLMLTGLMKCLIWS